MTLPVRLAKDLSRALRLGHPWVFRNALENDTPGMRHGEIVELQDAEGRAMATGFWDARSPIAVRVLAPGQVDDPRALVAERFREALQRRLGKLDRNRTNAFRWVHGEADRLPGVHVDLYADVAVVRFDGDGATAFYHDLGALLGECCPFPLREVIDRQSGERLSGAGAPAKFVVQENGLSFEVSPRVAGKGGLFLDQRENREEIERRAKGLSVLNLFGFSGAFSLYAMRGGARSTDTVDIAHPAILNAKRNFALNGMPIDQAGFHTADAFKFLEDAIAKRRRWDLVISDPPSFAPKKSAVAEARKAYGRLHKLCASVVARGGILCAASCSSHVGRDEFLASVQAGARNAKRRFTLETLRGAGFDHPVLKAFPEGDYLKFAIGRLD
jgi:23S rRNA (cytosine1962-C5)-methyltransferase